MDTISIYELTLLCIIDARMSLHLVHSTHDQVDDLLRIHVLTFYEVKFAPIVFLLDCFFVILVLHVSFHFYVFCSLKFYVVSCLLERISIVQFFV